MTAAEILDEINRCGARLEIIDEKPRVRGAKLPDELLAQIKANRDAVLQELATRERADRNRFCKVPSEDVPLMALDFPLPRDMQQVFEQYVMRQGPPAAAWVMRRSEEYFAQIMSADDCEWRACVDLVAWQRHTTARGALEFVSGLNEVANTFPPPDMPKGAEPEGRTELTKPTELKPEKKARAATPETPGLL